MRRSVGILTWHYYSNFGSALQAFALQTALEKLGCRAKIINYRNKKYGLRSGSKDNIRFILNKTLGKLPGKFGSRFNYPYLCFQKSYLKETGIFQEESKLGEICRKFDAVVCGSDQIWAPNVFNPVYMADFDAPNTKKISYAASIGLNDIPEELVGKYKELISEFDAVSVREEKGRELLSEKCGISSKVVLDPTLLVDVTDYKKLEKPVKNINEPYVFCYFLNKDHKYRERVESYAKRYNLKICGFSVSGSDSQWMDTVKRISPCEFLWLISNADTVFTDSYHGTIFSLLYHKKFYVFERFNKDDPICQNSRIGQLDSWFGIGNVTLSEDKMPTEPWQYDFGRFEESLKKERKMSIDFLTEALL